MLKTMKITKEQFDKLYSDNVSKREYDETIHLIYERFEEIVKKILPKRQRQWFDYQNCGYDNDTSTGYFNPNTYKLEIGIGGEYADLPEPYNMGSGIEGGYLENSFPTRWLWTDDEEWLKEFNTNIEKYKQEKLQEKKLAKQKRDELKKRKAMFRGIIKSKLTKEELKYITFK